jgi:hypothetical protein
MIGIIVGCIGYVMLFITRYLVYRTSPISKGEKLLKIISLTDLRKKNPETFESLLQIAYTLEIVFGYSYIFIISKIKPSNFLDGLLAFILVYGPAFFTIALGRFLKRKYWDAQ